MFGNHDDFVKQYLEPATVAAATRTGKLFRVKPATAGKLIVYRLHNQRLALPSSRQTFYELVLLFQPKGLDHSLSCVWD